MLNDREKKRSPVLVLAIVVLCPATALLLLLGGEIDAIRAELRYERALGLCEKTGDLQPCGTVAVYLAKNGDSVEDLDKARDMFVDRCEADPNPMGCRIAGTIHSATLSTTVRNPHPLLTERKHETAKRSCFEERDPRGCYVAVGLDLPANEVGRATEIANELCARGEAIACWAADYHGKTKDTPEAKRACAAGWTQSCNETTHKPVQACHRGDWRQCGFVSVPEEHAAANAMYELLARKVENNPEFEGVVPQTDVETLQEACASETSYYVTCFGAGLHLVNGETDSWKPELPPREELDATFGKACEHDIDVACKAYALRLLDRPLNETRDVAGANALLDKACSRGDAEACWLKSFEMDYLEEDFDRLREAAKVACAAAPARFEDREGPCEVLRHVYEVDIGAAPWIRSDRVAATLLRRQCSRTREPETCNRGLHLLARDFTPLASGGRFPRLTSWDMAVTACFKGAGHGCDNLLYVARRFEDRAPETEDEVRARLCEKKPSYCRR